MHRDPTVRTERKLSSVVEHTTHTTLVYVMVWYERGNESRDDRDEIGGTRAA
jgi:hypothetical protein